jgi:hypothetical protein
MKFVHVFESVYPKLENEKKMAMKQSNTGFLSQNSFNLFLYSEQEIKIDWDISLVFTPLCEIKFDGKLRAMEIFMDTNIICKVKK